MKTTIALLAFFCAIQMTFAQDQIYTINNYNRPSSDPHLILLHSINANNGNVSATTPFPSANPSSEFQSAALAINKYNYLYFIPEAPGVLNGGSFSVNSILSSSTSAPNTNVISGDINGTSTNHVFFRRLGIDQDDWAYMISTEEDGNGVNSVIYLTRFLTKNDGTASDFQLLGTINLVGESVSNFYNGDLAFDGNGDMYVLVNADQGNGITKIFKTSAAQIAAAAAANSASRVTDMTYHATVYAPGGGNFTGAVTGLGFASNGNLYLTAQDPVNPNSGIEGIYMISRQTSTGNVIATPGNYVPNGGLADIASLYYPTITILPVNYKSIKARIINNTLQVNWATASEKKNSRFDVEISKDGIQYTKIGSVGSKADNGNSSLELDYQFSYSLNGNMSVAGLGIFLLSLLGLSIAGTRRTKAFLTICVIASGGLFAISCNKTTEHIDTDNNNKIFVRLMQYDTDGNKNVSKIITAYKAD